MNKNIELKAVYPDLQMAQECAQRIGAILEGQEQQRDTYFRCRSGRLKLRQRWFADESLHCELIWYDRPDIAQPRTSHYWRFPITDDVVLLDMLSQAEGVKTVINKQRSIYHYDGVRIHLDQVDGKGNFIEFEAVVDATGADTEAHAKLRHLITAFNIRPDQLKPGSYADIDSTANSGLAS